MSELTKQQLLEKLQEHEAELAKLKAENEGLVAINQGLQAELEAGPATAEAAAEKPSFEVDGVTYGFVYPSVNHKGIDITPADVVASKELQAELLAMQSGFLTTI